MVLFKFVVGVLGTDFRDFAAFNYIQEGAFRPHVVTEAKGTGVFRRSKSEDLTSDLINIFYLLDGFRVGNFYRFPEVLVTFFGVSDTSYTSHGSHFGHTVSFTSSRTWLPRPQLSVSPISQDSFYRQSES